MQNNLAYNAYTQNQMGVESPQKLIEMLYEGLLKFCSRIKISIRNEDIERRTYNSKRATAIVEELSKSMEEERGGEDAY